MIIRVQTAIATAREEYPGVNHPTAIGCIIRQVWSLTGERSTASLSLDGASGAAPFDSVDLKTMCKYADE
jgi:hypothetical protein